jgi:uncharacterized protein (TIGR02145 family)
MISFSLSWDHSWRDDFNWDAVWVFGKYSKGTKGEWNHLKLSPTGHIMPSGFTYDAGNIDANNAGGVFLMRADKDAGNVRDKTFTVKVPKTNLSTVTDRDFSRGDIFISLSAVEMVYIPYGGYYLGDGATPNRLGGSTGAPIAVNSEDALNVYTVENSTVGTYKSLPSTTSANFPKGYKGFYSMKYEVSQEQYVSFLNTLTRTQQQARIGNNLAELKVGEYVFGDKSQPSYRNGICVLSNTSNKPAIFGCNLNPAEPYFGEDDGKCIACNYLTFSDMLAYCDWACLRPMSELEYEKACRRPYPQAAVAGEYVWNSASGVNGLSGITNSGRVNEQPSSVANNVNYNNGGFGPVRSASFGTSSSTQAQAGATFWGLMEMSGNVAELCYSVNAYSVFNTYNIYTSHGNGAINANGTSDIATSIWANTASSFIAKGGSFASTNADELKISDRSRATVTDTRDSTVGFRAVHTFGGSVTVDQGIITLSPISCADGINVRDSIPASVTWNGELMNMKMNYVWYVKEAAATTWSLIPDEVSADLQGYKPLTSITGTGITVKFKRKAVSSLGEAESAEVSTIVNNLNITLDKTTLSLDACGSSGTVTASISYIATPSPTFTWTTQTGTKTGASYTPAYSDFVNAAATDGDMEVECSVEISGCKNTSDLTVSVSPATPSKITFACENDFTDSSDGQVYPTVLIGEQCWMAANINVGERVGGGTSTQNTAGIQRICHYDNETYCDTYGGLYNWWETVYGENIGKKKCVVDSKGYTVTQGICPDGWHVPSDDEFKTLEMYLGMTQAQADVYGDHWSRDTDQGTQLKSETMSGGTNNSGWSGLPGGYSGAYLGSYGFWWSSSEYDSSNAWHRALFIGSSSTYRNGRPKSIGMSVRCLLN